MEVNSALVIHVLGTVSTNTWANAISKAGINVEGTASKFISDPTIICPPTF